MLLAQKKFLTGFFARRLGTNTYRTNIHVIGKLVCGGSYACCTALKPVCLTQATHEAGHW